MSPTYLPSPELAHIPGFRSARVNRALQGSRPHPWLVRPPNGIQKRKLVVSNEFGMPDSWKVQTHDQGTTICCSRQETPRVAVSCLDFLNGTWRKGGNLYQYRILSHEKPSVKYEDIVIERAFSIKFTTMYFLIAITLRYLVRAKNMLRLVFISDEAVSRVGSRDSAKSRHTAC